MSSIADLYHGQLDRAIGSAIKELLMKKHLYQSVSVDIEGITRGVESAKSLLPRERVHLSDRITRFFRIPWIPPTDPIAPTLVQGSATTIFDVPDIKLHCTTCERTEPFNFVYAEDLLLRGKGGSNGAFHTDNFEHVQIFAITYLCQSCKSIPEVMLIRREGAKLTLSGRSPIEHVTVPAYVPKAVRGYFSGAIVGHQSGQTLAGLFLLRTVIEQWVRSLGAQHERADQAIDWYVSRLPEDFKTRFPSLREQYGELSAAIHKADASADLFDRSRRAICEHFDAARLYKLDWATLTRGDSEGTANASGNAGDAGRG